MTKVQRTTTRYSDCFKLQVVEEIEKNGLTIDECRLKYGIGGGSTIQRWVRKYGKQHLLNKIVRVETRDEIDELKRLRAENKALKEAYADLSLQHKDLSLQYAELSVNHKCSEKVIEVADELYDMDLKKKYEQELSHYFKKKKR
ncbi:MAG TPA: transposase [Bacteroidales bacterium]|nr:transposase [Bacteroidales bacterium]